jgi:hypothetical protein
MDFRQFQQSVRHLQQASGLTQSTRPARKPGKSAPPLASYQIKITLQGSKPPIWRRVVVPAGLGLELFHYVIQEAMGWGDCHLHQFDIDGESFVGRAPDGSRMDEMDGEDETKYRLCDVIDREKQKFHYEYDFGDGWRHALLVEKTIPGPQKPPIVCLAGKGRCPPEDCGGIWGYYETLKIVNDASHPEHEEILDWMGEIDPEEFRLEVANARLKHLKPS